MYVNFINDRKELEYKLVKDTNFSIDLALIPKSSVIRNRSLNRNSKTKKVVIVMLLIGGFWFSDLKEVKAIGLPMPPKLLVKVQPNYKNKYEMKVAPTVRPKLDRITFIKYRDLPFCIYFMDEKFLKTSQAQRLINQIRGGNLFETATALVVILLLCQMFVYGGFVINTPNVGWGADRSNQFQPPGGHLRYPPIDNLFFSQRTPAKSGSSLLINQPTAMPNDEFNSLTKAERRALPHHHDMRIITEGGGELEVGFWQARFKVGDHGEVHNLPYTVKSNGKSKTEKTTQNTLNMMKSIVDMPSREGVQWFENGTYQGGTERGFEAIHIYDSKNKVIAVFKKSTGKFVTTCRLTDMEDKELKATGNFGGMVKPEQTSINTFESDVKGITPISPITELNPINENSSPGFTPINNFESDVMCFSPIDKSQFDK